MKGYFVFALLCGASSICTAQAGAQAAPSLAAAPVADQAPAPVAGQAPAPVAGQAANPPALEEIVVTAQKRSENLQKVPIAITAISPLKLAASGVTSLQNLGAAVPGLTLLNVAGQLTPHIRGVGSTSASVGIEPAVATYVDGVYYSNTGDLRIDLGDVQQVTVLKGPQGTLFGRNATGGVIQITTPDPNQQFHLNIGTSIDNYLTSRSHAYVSGGLAPNLAARLSVSFITQGDGWGKNIYDNTDTHQIKHAISLRSKLVWTPDARDTVKLEFDYSDTRDNMGANFRNFPGLGGIFAPPQASNKWDTNSYVDSLSTYQGGGVSLNAQHDLGFARLVSISAYRDSSLFDRFPVTASNVPTEDISNLLSNSQQYTQELQLLSPSSGRLTWVLGAFYFWQKASAPGFTLNFHSFFAEPFSQIMSFGSQKTNSIAGFAQATYKITPSTRLTGGIRYTYEKRDFAASEYGTFAANAVTIPLTGNIDSSLSSSKPTWRVALDQDIGAGIVYASWNRGEKSGGFNVTNPTNAAFQPEQLDDYEVGLKESLFDRRLRFDVAGYYYNYKNLQIGQYPQGVEVIINGARAHIYGIDGSMQAKLSTNLTLDVGASWAHPKFVDFPNAPTAIAAPGAFGAAGGLALTTIPNASGNTIPYSPKFTYSVGLSYVIPSAKGDFTLSAADNYSSGYYGEPDNVLKQNAYHLVSASIKWKSPDQLLEMRLFADNLLNKAVISQMTTETGGYIADYSNPPRIYGVSAQYSF